MRLVRGSMIDALESEYVTSARLRGIPERRIIWKHVLPNALVPVVQGTALTIRVLLVVLSLLRWFSVTPVLVMHLMQQSK